MRSFFKFLVLLNFHLFHPPLFWNPGYAIVFIWRYKPFAIQRSLKSYKYQVVSLSEFGVSNLFFEKVTREFGVIQFVKILKQPEGVFWMAIKEKNYFHKRPVQVLWQAE